MPAPDLIGVITDVGPFDFAGPMSKIQIHDLGYPYLFIFITELINHHTNFYISDICLCIVSKINKVLWDQEGENFDKKQVIEKSQDGIVVGIFAGLTVSKFLGQSSKIIL